jgi:hypothetical protein
MCNGGAADQYIEAQARRAFPLPKVEKPQEFRLTLASGSVCRYRVRPGSSPPVIEWMTPSSDRWTDTGIDVKFYSSIVNLAAHPTEWVDPEESGA